MKRLNLRKSTCMSSKSFQHSLATYGCFLTRSSTSSHHSAYQLLWWCLCWESTCHLRSSLPHFYRPWSRSQLLRRLEQTAVLLLSSFSTRYSHTSWPRSLAKHFLEPSGTLTQIGMVPLRESLSALSFSVSDSLSEIKMLKQSLTKSIRRSLSRLIRQNSLNLLTDSHWCC